MNTSNHLKTSWCHDDIEEAAWQQPCGINKLLEEELAYRNDLRLAKITWMISMEQGDGVYQQDMPMQFPHYTGYDEDDLNNIPYPCGLVSLSLSFLVCKPSLHVTSLNVRSKKWIWHHRICLVLFEYDTLAAWGHWKAFVRRPCKLKRLEIPRLLLGWPLRSKVAVFIALPDKSQYCTTRGIVAKTTWISFYTNLALMFSFFLSSPFLQICSQFTSLCYVQYLASC